MQFFEHQDQAKGRTTLLLTLFAFAVLGLVALSAGAVHFVLSSDRLPDMPLGEHHWSHVALGGSLTLGIILLGSGYRMLQLRGGGMKVAETLGGTLASVNSHDPLERRVINVVEEMAIASGLVVPPVYILRREKGINAFAAGWSPDDAVIGVTQGTLEALNRDQLQGVIAHEFSHILNRDCALNMRLMGVLHGIVLISIIGRIMIQFGAGSGSSRKKSDGQAHFLIAGAAIWLFGSLGVLVARLIQSAVSRQREYLADASAVQFTRNPLGIGGALATIGSQSSSLSSPRGGETSHLLFGEPGSMSFLSSLSSHPPLFDRICRVLPTWDGDFAAIATPPGSVRKALESSRISARELAEGVFESNDDAMAQHILNGGQLMPAPLSRAQLLLSNIGDELRSAAEEPFSARALIVAWVLDPNPSERETQLALLGIDAPLAAETQRLLRLIPTLHAHALLPLFDIAAGTMALLSAPQKERFAQVLSDLRAQLSDKSYRSYCLSTLALRRLQTREESKMGEKLLIKDAIETVLGILAVQGHDRPEQVLGAFNAGVFRLGKRGSQLTLPPGSGLTVHRLEASLNTLLKLPHTTRTDLLNAAESIAGHDGLVRPSEAELLRVMAVCLGLAVPPAYAS